MLFGQKFALTFFILLFCNYCFGQNPIIDVKSYHLDKTIRQNKSVFKFWVGSTDSTNNKLVVERRSQNKTSILYDGFIRDGIYETEDINGDGYKDFITTYHDYDLVYFFDKQKNCFKDKALYMPMTFGLVDGARKIYWGYRDAQYSDLYDYSIIYTYIGTQPYFYYQLKYITKDGRSERQDVTKIELYKFKNGSYTNPVFIKQLKTTHPGNFNYREYWKKHYLQLLNLH